MLQVYSASTEGSINDTPGIVQRISWLAIHCSRNSGRRWGREGPEGLESRCWDQAATYSLARFDRILGGDLDLVRSLVHQGGHGGISVHHADPDTHT